jgi:hypothetical protein
VRGAQEVPAVAHLLMRAERQRVLVDLPAACMTKLVPARNVGSSVISDS